MVLRGLNCRRCCFCEWFWPLLVWIFGLFGAHSGPCQSRRGHLSVVHVPMHDPPPARAAGLGGLSLGWRHTGLGFDTGLFAHRLARELEAVVVLHQPVQHRIGNRGLANPFVPVLNVSGCWNPRESGCEGAVLKG